LPLLAKMPKGSTRILKISSAQGLEMKIFFKSRCSCSRVFALHTNTQLVIKIHSLRKDSPNFNLRLIGMMDGNMPQTLKQVMWKVITMDNDDDSNSNNYQRIIVNLTNQLTSWSRIPLHKLILSSTIQEFLTFNKTLMCYCFRAWTLFLS
jgi:hypothetical protein